MHGLRLALRLTATGAVLNRLLALQVLPGGLVIWRSAAIVPPYAKLIENAGFNVKCLQKAQDGYMDRVNMYCSFWVAERR